MSETMKALAMAFQTGETTVVDVAKPKVAAPTDVVVKVQYSALDTAVENVVKKTFAGFFLHAKAEPLVLGWHYAGAVESAGADAEHDLKKGDAVFGFLEYDPRQAQGSFSEYVRVRADQCARIPPGADPKAAAAAATGSVTSLQAMRDCAGLSASQSVLVLGAGGGVGSAAVAVAKRLGARVTAVCSARDVDRVRGLGADEVLDRAEVDVFAAAESEAPRTFDVIFDAPAKYSPLQCFKHLTPKGSYVTTLPTLGFFVGKLVSLFNGKGSSCVMCAPKRNDLALVGEWLAGGMAIDVDSTFPVRDTKSAVARNGDKSKAGRIVIQVEGGW